VISDLLRDKDQLTLMHFSDWATTLVDGRAMDADGKRAALQALQAIAIGGGTQPATAIAELAGKQLRNCGLFFISDGQFEDAGWVSQRPDCNPHVFAIGHTVVPPADAPISRLATPIPVPANFDPSGIRLDYFEGRDKSYEVDPFRPRPLGETSGDRSQLKVPELDLDGWAVTYAQADADVIAVVPRLADPVLAFRQSDGGYVGAFTSHFPPAWYQQPEGQTAIESWIRYVLPLQAPDRYTFELADHGQSLELTIALVPGSAGGGLAVPAVTGLTADLVAQGQTLGSLTLLPAGDVPATFRGRLQVPRAAEAQLATLVLRETGPEALPRTQRLAFVIPPAGAGASAAAAASREAYS
jgi:hypothetical protein